jgi:hypothetical protein
VYTVGRWLMREQLNEKKVTETEIVH